MDGENGKKMKDKVLQWKELAKNATSGPNGSSFLNLDNMVHNILLGKIVKN